jgi:hypothetical protein
MLLKGLDQLKNPMTSSKIRVEAATFQLVAYPSTYLIRSNTFPCMENQ